jgi:hypothetical protein
MPAAVKVPDVLASGDGWLALEAIDWAPRKRVDEIPLGVAAALGTFFAAGARGDRGPAHGDFAPWNLLASGDAWALVDWELARGDEIPFYDLFHHSFQTAALLRRPSPQIVVDEIVRVKGPIGAALHAYAWHAGVDARTAGDYLRSYLAGLGTLTGTPRDVAARSHARAEMIAGLGRAS